MSELIEYKVRPVTRYIVTRFASDGDKKGRSDQHGSFDTEQIAYAVAYALCAEEHKRLNWPIGDERIQYPKPVL